MDKIEQKVFNEWKEIQPEVFETERKLKARWVMVRTMRLKHLTTNTNKEDGRNKKT